MSLGGVISTWVTSGPLGTPYIGERSWAVRLPSWPMRWRSLGSLSSSAQRGAKTHVLERRRNPSELRTWAGRQKRGRRTVLTAWDRQARRRALERGRERAR